MWSFLKWVRVPLNVSLPRKLRVLIVLEYHSAGSRGEAGIARSISGEINHHKRRDYLLSESLDCAVNHHCCATLQDGLGRNGLNGLPGNPGLKVWTSSSLNLEFQNICFLASVYSIRWFPLKVLWEIFWSEFGTKSWRWKPDVICRESRDREESLDWWVHDNVIF